MVVALDQKPTAPMSLGGLSHLQEFFCWTIRSCKKADLFCYMVSPSRDHTPIPRPTLCLMFCFPGVAKMLGHNTELSDTNFPNLLLSATFPIPHKPSLSCHVLFCSPPSFHGPIRLCAWACSLVQSMPYLFWTFPRFFVRCGYHQPRPAVQ